jgi:hypothetical protein
MLQNLEQEKEEEIYPDTIWSLSFPYSKHESYLNLSQS